MKMSRQENTITFGYEIQSQRNVFVDTITLTETHRCPTVHMGVCTSAHTHTHLGNTKNSEERMTLINTQRAFHLQSQLRQVKET